MPIPQNSELRIFSINGYLTIEYLLTGELDTSTFLLVDIPHELDSPRRDRDKTRFPNSFIAAEMPEFAQLSFSDPILKLKPQATFTWFMHPDFDLVEIFSDIAAAIAQQHGIKPRNVLFHGFSQGGFGAIGCASHLAGSRAFAQVPQIDLGLWKPSDLKPIEQHILHKPLGEYRHDHPEQVTLMHRITKAGFLPQTIIYTNEDDPRIVDQYNFLKWAEAWKFGDSTVEVILSQHIRGHVPMKEDELRIALEEFLTA